MVRLMIWDVIAPTMTSPYWTPGGDYLLGNIIFTATTIHRWNHGHLLNRKLSYSCLMRIDVLHLCLCITSVCLCLFISLYIDGSVQDYMKFRASARELLQSCATPPTCIWLPHANTSVIRSVVIVVHDKKLQGKPDILIIARTNTVMKLRCIQSDAMSSTWEIKGKAGCFDIFTA